MNYLLIKNDQYDSLFSVILIDSWPQNDMMNYITMTHFSVSTEALTHFSVSTDTF